MNCEHSSEFACVECADQRASLETPLAVNDGDWIVPTPQEGFRWGCCDCGLMHSVDFRVVDGQVEMRVYRDASGTAALRQKLQRFRTADAGGHSMPHVPDQSRPGA